MHLNLLDFFFFFCKSWPHSFVFSEYNIVTKNAEKIRQLTCFYCILYKFRIEYKCSIFNKNLI